MKDFEIYNDVYSANLVVVIGGDKDELVSLMKKKYKCDIYKYYSKEFRLGAGSFFDFEGDYPYRMIWLKKFVFNPEWIGSLVHEISHHVSNLCDKRGISKHSDFDEPVAYMTEYYIREILERIKKLK